MYAKEEPIKILLNIFISEEGLEEKVLWKILKKLKFAFNHSTNKSSTADLQTFKLSWEGVFVAPK